MPYVQKDILMGEQLVSRINEETNKIKIGIDTVMTLITDGVVKFENGMFIEFVKVTATTQGTGYIGIQSKTTIIEPASAVLITNSLGYGDRLLDVNGYTTANNPRLLTFYVKSGTSPVLNREVNLQYILIGRYK